MIGNIANGYGTYILGALVVLYGVIQTIVSIPGVIEVDSETGIKTVIAGLLILTGRRAIKKIGK